MNSADKKVKHAQIFVVENETRQFVCPAASCGEYECSPLAPDYNRIHWYSACMLDTATIVG